MTDDHITMLTDDRVDVACGQNVVPANKIDKGTCHLGTTVCENADIVCKGTVGPQLEICNNKDDDCNDRVDDGPAAFEPCHNPGNPLLGECRPGYFPCHHGVAERNICLGEVLPSRELCDGKDHDCNGEVDNGCDLSII